MLFRFILATLLIPTLQANELFERAKPILEQHCLSCHNPKKTKGGLRLDTRAMLLEGGDEDLAIDLNDPTNSYLLKLVSLPHDDDDIMPSKGRPLNQLEISSLTEWVNSKAPWPDGEVLVSKKPEIPLAALTDNLTDNLTFLQAYPQSISLESARDFHAVIVYGSYADATTRDLTNQATLKLTDPSIAKLKGNVLTPLKDGETSLTVSLGETSTTVPVKVTNATTRPPISFQLDVMPVITAAGCNTGSCHGSARGQDGFQLSLFGFDPKGDYHRMTRELPGRRLNTAIPEASLFLTKAAGQVPHSGGKILLHNSEGYQTLLEWIRDGAHYDAKDITQPTSIDVYPKQTVTRGPEQIANYTVLAKYSDGTDRDVTPLSTFSTSNDTALKVDNKTKTTTSGNRGEAFIMARYHTFTKGSQAIVIPLKDNYQGSPTENDNYIDKHIGNKLHKLRVTPSDLCSDEVFIRRVYIDILGKLPTVEQRNTFLANPNSDKRNQLVDHLLTQPEFNDIWVMKWAELLQIRTFDNDVSYKAATLYHTWLREQFSANLPFNQVVRDIISARGGTFSSPATNFYQVERDNLKLSENVAQVFMGTRLQCAQCHNHPFDQWTMEDYYGFAAFFSEVKRKKAEDPREQIIFDGKGEVKHPVTKQNVPPRFLGGATPKKDNRSRREHLADWLTAAENPWFARNVVNIIWEHFLGRGIVHPVDDVRISNPPSNPELLDYLAMHFVSYNYDFKKIVRDICTSKAYQRSTHTNASNQTDLENFSHAIPRRMRAEILLDVISQVTNTPNKFKGLPKGAKAVSIADGNTSNYFLTTFGRSTRQTVCSCEVKMEPNLSQALHLLNGSSTNQKVLNGKIVNSLIQTKKSDSEIIESLYLTTLTRKPTESETSQLLSYLDSTPDQETRQQILQDIFWSLLNSKEFIFNH